MLEESEFSQRLDDASLRKDLDRENMLEALDGFSRQCAEAVAIAVRAPLPDQLADAISAVIVAGMGGSGIGGDLAKLLLDKEMSVPFQVVKGYRLPAFTNKNTLVIIVSYSGNTEEALSCFKQAVSCKAKVVCLTSGGKLAEEAESRGLALIQVPAGLQPRAALGYLFLPLLVVLSRLNLSSFDEKQLGEALNWLQKASNRFGPGVSFKDNQAKQIAVKIRGRIPVVYGSDGINAPVALRWKCQFNENSKNPAFFHLFPELNHNELVGWEERTGPGEKFCLILLRDDLEPIRLKKRIEVTKELIQSHVGEVIEVEAEGESPLAKILSLVYLGDYVSVYLAFLNGVDPSPVDKIVFLKEKLAEVESDRPL